LVIISGILFFTGYLTAFFSNGRFLMLYTGIAILVGIATGFGYLASISVPVQWFPHKKGLITGIVSAGFGAGAIIISYFSNFLLSKGFDVLQIFMITGIVYGSVIILASYSFQNHAEKNKEVDNKHYISFRNLNFIRLFLGIFTGTFAGLLVIGNLKPIGLQHNIEADILIKGIALFSLTNFAGRLFWGFINDYIPGKILIPFSIMLIGLFTLFIGHLRLNAILYLLFTGVIGFSFGANFVIYAKETAQLYGVDKLRRVYPYVFLGYGLAGILGPTAGGYLYDLSGNYRVSSTISFYLCIAVMVFIIISSMSIWKLKQKRMI